MNRDAIINILEACKLFTGFSRYEVEKFYEACTPKTFRLHDVVFRRHEKSTSLYIILDGSVEILLASQEKLRQDKQMVFNPKRVTKLERGDFFGELAVVSKHKRSATVRCSKDNTLTLKCKRESFKEYCLNNEKAGLQLLFNISKEFSSTIDKSNQIILEQHLRYNIVYLLHDCLWSIDETYNLLNPQVSHIEVRESENFLFSHHEMFRKFPVELEQLKFIIFADKDSLKKVLFDPDVDLVEAVTTMLEIIRGGEMDPLLAHDFGVQEVKNNECISGKMCIVGEDEGEEGAKIFFQWRVKGLLYNETTCVIRASIELQIYQQSKIPEYEMHKRASYVNMPVLEHVKGYLKKRPGNQEVDLIVIHHRTPEVVKTLLMMRELGFNVFAFIGIPYGNKDKSIIKMLDYASGSNTFNIKSYFDHNKKLNFVFDFEGSSPLTLSEEQEIQERFESFEQNNYFSVMLGLITYVLENALGHALEKGRPLLILEDGGYLFPLLHQIFYDTAHPLHSLAGEAISKGLIKGVVEGTASGEVRSLTYINRLSEPQRPMLPLLSGARDDIKTIYESKGVALSIIYSSALAFMNLGRESFETRKIAVIGANGAIGTRLVEQLVAQQQSVENIFCVDIADHKYREGCFTLPFSCPQVKQHVKFQPLHRYVMKEKDKLYSSPLFFVEEGGWEKRRDYCIDLLRSLEAGESDSHFVIPNCSFDVSKEVYQQLEKIAIDEGFQVQQGGHAHEKELNQIWLKKLGKEFAITLLPPNWTIQYDRLREPLLHHIDTVIGVSGFSAFNALDLDCFLFRNQDSTFIDTLTLISGSSKDIEFKPAIQLMENLLTLYASPSEKELASCFNYLKGLQKETLQLFKDPFYQLFFSCPEFTDQARVIKLFRSLQPQLLELIPSPVGKVCKDIQSMNDVFRLLMSYLSHHFSIHKENINNFGSIYTLQVDQCPKQVLLVSEGYPVNFYTSLCKGITSEFIDPILAEQVLGVVHLRDNEAAHQMHRIASLLPSDLQKSLWRGIEKSINKKSPSQNSS